MAVPAATHQGARELSRLETSGSTGLRSGTSEPGAAQQSRPHRGWPSRPPTRARRQRGHHGRAMVAEMSRQKSHGGLFVVKRPPAGRFATLRCPWPCHAPTVVAPRRPGTTFTPPWRGAADIRGTMTPLWGRRCRHLPSSRVAVTAVPVALKDRTRRDAARGLRHRATARPAPYGVPQQSWEPLPRRCMPFGTRGLDLAVAPR